MSWLEEPLPSVDVTGHQRLAARIPIPIAGGEHLLGQREFAQYLRHDAIAIAQPDAALTGGITEALRILRLCEAFGVDFAPHFLPELHVHLAAVAERPSWIEHFPLIDDLITTHLRPTGGLAEVPTAPGHGINWDDEALARFRIHSTTNGGA